MLPSQLQWLRVTWALTLADLALPPSLTRLEVEWLPIQQQLPIPPHCLPPHLHTLHISQRFDLFDTEMLCDALPASLRVLSLHCRLTKPLTTELLAQVPLLEELYFKGFSSRRIQLTAGVLAPLTQLRVLCVREMWQPFTPGVLPLSLRKVVVRASTRQEADELVPMVVRHAGLVVAFVHFGSAYCVQHVGDIFNESRVMAAQAMQRSEQ